jgi:hypothetical protein
MKEEDFGNLPGLFDALYSRLLLRDFFGKVIPGAIVIFSMCLATWPWTYIQKFIQDLSFISGLILIGLSWILAFALQGVGEVTHLLRYHICKTSKDFYGKRNRFHMRTNARQHQQLERLEVIREACGNGYIALSLSGLFLILNGLARDGYRIVFTVIVGHWPVIVFGGILVIFLAVMHFFHVRRQDEYMNVFLEVPPLGEQ